MRCAVGDCAAVGNASTTQRIVTAVIVNVSRAIMLSCEFLMMHFAIPRTTRIPTPNRSRLIRTPVCNKDIRYARSSRKRSELYDRLGSDLNRGDLSRRNDENQSHCCQGIAIA